MQSVISKYVILHDTNEWENGSAFIYPYCSTYLYVIPIEIICLENKLRPLSPAMKIHKFYIFS